MNKEIKQVLVTGGAGYVGAVLVPQLLKEGYFVTVLDLYLYGDDVLQEMRGHHRLTEVKGDIRDTALLALLLEGKDALIHLACISNDPSFELDPQLGKAINYNAFISLYEIAYKKGVKRFIYVSSSSVYGVKEVENVSEDMPLEPLTDYSRYKALCEKYILQHLSDDMTTLILRPATVCGYSPRQRMDLTVNILTNHAVNTKKIKVFGGAQKRPNIHIKDIVNLYIKALSYPHEKIHGKIFNAGYENHTVREIADIVKQVVGDDTIQIIVEPTDDMRSYHISSEKIEKELGFLPQHTIEEAVADVWRAFKEGKLPGSLTDKKYFNIKTMQEKTLLKASAYEHCSI